MINSAEEACLSSNSSDKTTTKLVAEITKFVGSASGLAIEEKSDKEVTVIQHTDGKKFKFSTTDLVEVLPRVDLDGKDFIQVNFTSGMKVLFTDNLVGFKPFEVTGLDMSKIPRVVTTPDLMSVFEAIEESLSSEDGIDMELDILRKVYQSILIGGEMAGFDLKFERKWMDRLYSVKFQASA